MRNEELMNLASLKQLYNPSVAVWRQLPFPKGAFRNEDVFKKVWCYI